MKLKHGLISLIAASGLSLFALSAQAAPAGGMADGLKSAAVEGSAVEDVARRCYRHRGHVHCYRSHRRHYRGDRFYGYPGYNYGYSGFYGPGFSLYLGPRHRHHHRHRHWR